MRYAQLTAYHTISNVECSTMDCLRNEQCITAFSNHEIDRILATEKAEAMVEKVLLHTQSIACALNDATQCAVSYYGSPV